MDQLSVAHKFIKYTQQHIFLTGKAGTGKTTFLQQVKTTCTKNMVVLAPTGVAAINAGGVTIHSFFQLHFGLFIANFQNNWGEHHLPVLNTQQLLQRLKYNSNKRKIIQELELLIIDEISMVRADVIDAIDTILQHVRKKVGVPFGGVQMLFIGDLFQLPPVLKDDELRFMRQYYRSPYFFDAHAFKNEQPLYIELQKVHRQSDEEFIGILNHIRSGYATEEDLATLDEQYNPLYMPRVDEKIITLTTHNKIADEINQIALANLVTPNYALHATVDGEFPEHLYPIDTTLQFKVGAQVMFIKNDKGENRRYFNGKLATIEAINLQDKQIVVSFEKEKELYTLEQESWNNIRYRFDDGKNEVVEEVIGTFTQYPIKLAWAVTIHKSQGLTFDKAIIDAGRAFAPGQVYVALSRLRSIEGLILKSRIQNNSITTDQLILEYSKEQLPLTELIKVLKFAQIYYIEQQIKSAFDFQKILDQYHLFNDTYSHLNFYNEDILAQDRYLWQDQMYEIAQTGFQFIKQLDQLFQKGNNQYKVIEERINKAGVWFTNKLNQDVIKQLDKFKIEADKLSKSKKFFTDLNFIKRNLLYHNTLMEQSGFFIHGLINNLDPDMMLSEADQLFGFHQAIAALDKLEMEQPQTAKLTTQEVSYHMFIDGKSIAEIASERNLVSSTIESHLIKFIGTGQLDVKKLVKEEDLQIVLKYLKNNPNQKLTEMKAELGDHISYGTIKAAIEYSIYLSNRLAR